MFSDTATLHNNGQGTTRPPSIGSRPERRHRPQDAKDAHSSSSNNSKWKMLSASGNAIERIYSGYRNEGGYGQDVHEVYTREEVSARSPFLPQQQMQKLPNRQKQYLACSSNNKTNKNILLALVTCLMLLALQMPLPAVAMAGLGGLAGVSGAAGLPGTIVAESTNGNITELPGSPVLTQANLIPHGSQQLYSVVNKVSMAEVIATSPATREDISYTFTSQLKVNSVWHAASGEGQLLQIFFTNSFVEAPAKGGANQVKRDITSIPDRPFYVSLVDGRPHKVIAHTSRDQSLLNLERGVASLLQLQQADGPISELDVSGQCNVFYRVKSSTRVEKTKSDCSHWDLRVTYRGEKSLGINQHSNEEVHYDLSADGQLLRAASTESHSVTLNSKTDVGSRVVSEFVLQHVSEGAESVEQLEASSLDEAIKSLLEWYRVFDIEADVDGAISEIKDKSLSKEISKNTQALKSDNIGKEELAVAFVQLLPLARITKKEEFEEILRAHKDLHQQLVDLFGAVQTYDAHLAVHEVFQYSRKSDWDILEKYLQSLAVSGTHPERSIIEDLLKRFKAAEDQEGWIQNEKLRDSVIQTIAALTRQSGFDPNDPLLTEVRSLILHKLTDECKGTDIECQTCYIRALLNLLDVSTIPQLIELSVRAQPVEVSVAAMFALKHFVVTNFRETERRVFADIFYQRQRKFDTTARIYALDILLAMKPTKPQLDDLLDYLRSNDRNFEIKTYVIQKLRMLADKCPRFAALLQGCLAERPWVNNWHVLAQKGLTTVLTRQLSQSPAFNESLLSVQEVYKGVLKRGSVELVLSAEREETSTFKLGIYTRGLTSFVGGDEEDSGPSDDEEDSDSPSTAGMDISVQGVLLRPLVFFSGQSELMGHVWSGTASDITPAYQATTLTNDHEMYVILSSGATTYVRVLGSKSVDLNGKVELSIWNRNANTEIHQNTADGVVGVMVTGFTYARVENEFVLTVAPKLSLQADIDFYSDIKLCMQLQRPETELKHSNVRSVHLMGNKSYTKRVQRNLKHLSPGRTLALNQKNNEMCNMIFA